MPATRQEITMSTRSSIPFPASASLFEICQRGFCQRSSCQRGDFQMAIFQRGLVQKGLVQKDLGVTETCLPQSLTLKA
jgi:hypothetical protein